MLKDTTRRVQVGSEGPAGRLDDKQRDRKTFESPFKERKRQLWATALAGRRTDEDYSTTTLALDGDKNKSSVGNEQQEGRYFLKFNKS